MIHMLTTDIESEVSSQDKTSIICPPVGKGVTPSIPRNCCYHCLTRGGNAAYECFTEEGEERCTRCIRDKKTRCRIPTSDEAAVIAARCPRCTQRGFKQCNGGDPCDTCRRNRTPHLCRKQPTKKSRLEQPSKAHCNHPSDNAPPVRSSRSQTTNQIDGSKNRAVEQAIVNEPSSAVPSGYRRGERMALRRSSRIAAKSVLPLRPHGPTNNPNQGFPKSRLILGEIAIPNHKRLTKALDTEISRDIHALSLRSKKYIGQDCIQVSYTERPELKPSSNESEACHSTITSEESRIQVEPTSADEASLIGDNDLAESVMPEKSLVLRGNRPTTNLGRSNKGVDLKAPPLSSLEECMFDMTAKAVDLGLLDSLSHLEGRPIRIATMCSGTESPLLALDEISRGKQLTFLMATPLT